MAISFINYTLQDYTPASANQPQTVTLPSGWATNDLLIMFLMNGTSGATCTCPNWTLIANWAVNGTDAEIAIFYKIATESESNPTYTMSNTYGYALCVAYRGIDTSTPFDTTWDAAHGSDTAASSTRTVPTINTSTSGAMLVSTICSDESAGWTNPNFTAPTNWTKRTGSSETENNTGEHYIMGLADYVPASTGSQSGHSWTSATTDRTMPLVVLALKPTTSGTNYTRESGTDFTENGFGLTDGIQHYQRDKFGSEPLIILDSVSVEKVDGKYVNAQDAMDTTDACRICASKWRREYGVVIP